MNIFSQSRDAYVLYSNAQIINLGDKDTITKEHVTFITNKNKPTTEALRIPDIFNGLNDIMHNLQQLTSNNIILLSLIQTDREYAYFMPYREHYSDLLSSNPGKPFAQRVLSEYNIPQSYSIGKAGNCPVFLTEIYHEKISMKKMFSMIQPFYEKGKLQGLIMVDIKHDFIKREIDVFNQENKTTFYIVPQGGYKINIPCTRQQVRIDYASYNLLTLSNLFYSLIISAILSFSFYRYINIRDNSYRDKLTGIYNRTYALENLKRMPRTYGLFIFDIDNFKNINDTYGHDVGDTVLRRVSHIIATSIRREDIFARWGGEEFVLMIASNNIDMQIERIESLRKTIATTHIIDIPVTLSIGGTMVEAAHFDHAFKFADTLLYQAKQSGKNKLVFSAFQEYSE